MFVAAGTAGAGAGGENIEFVGAEAKRSPAGAAGLAGTLVRAAGAAIGALPKGELASLLLPNKLLASPPAFVFVTLVGLATGLAATGLSKGLAALDELPNNPLASPPFETEVTFFSTTFLGTEAVVLFAPNKSAAALGAAFANGSDIFQKTDQTCSNK